MVRSLVVLFVFGLEIDAVRAVPEAPALVTARPPDIVAHLEQTVGWYHFVTLVADSTAADVFQRDAVRQQGLNAVRLGFEFARAEAALLARQPAAANAPNSSQPTRSQNFQQAATRASDRVNSIQSQIQDRDAVLKRAPARSRADLTAWHAIQRRSPASPSGRCARNFAGAEVEFGFFRRAAVGDDVTG